MRRWLLIAIVLLAALGPAASASAESADVVDADVALRLAPNGDLLVTETLTFDYKGHFEGSYRDIVLRHGEEITLVKFAEGGLPYEPGGNTMLGSFDFPGRFGVERIPGSGDEETVRVVWHYRATDQTKTYELSYRVRGGAVAHDDVIDVAWEVWGSEWDFDLDHLTASFTDAALDPSDPDYRVWGHPRDVDGSTVRGEGRATLEARDVPSGTGVDLRVTVPRDPGRSTEGMRVASGEGLPGILADEKALDDDYNSTLNKAKRWVRDNAVAVTGGLAALALLVLGLLALLAREHRQPVPEHLPEPPDDAPPALAYALAHEGEDSKNTVLATLLDLVDRGYYRSSQATTDKEKLDLAVQVASDRPSTARLEPYEREVLGFFDKLLGDHKVALSKMRDKIPEHSELWRGRWSKMTEKLNDAEKGHLSWDRDLGRARRILVLALAVLVLVVVLVAHPRGPWLPAAAIGVAAMAVVAFFPRRYLRRVSPAHSERCVRWRAFEEWTRDFPRLEDDPPATLELWKRILVYGVAFGTAERMIESGRIPEPVVAAAAGDIHWSSFAVTHSLTDSFDGSAFSSGFASQVAPESSSSGGGGSFSGGGGGGFSGGGGGGSW